MNKIWKHITLILWAGFATLTMHAQTKFPVAINESEEIIHKHQILQSKNLKHSDVSTHMLSIDDTLLTRFSEIKVDKDNFFFHFYPNFNIGAGLQKDNQFISSNSIGFYSDLAFLFDEQSISIHAGGNFFAGLQAYYMRLLMQQRRIVPGLHSQKLINRTWNTAWEPDLHIQYHTPWLLTLEGGIGKQKIGDGYRSLILSEHAPSYPWAGLRSEFEKVNYQFRWLMLENHAYQPWVDPEAGKYAMMHYLSWNIGKNFNLGLFESIIWSDDDGRQAFEAQYINPFIFFRPVEFSIGSSDNALMGINMHYNIAETFQIYGQFILDDVQIGQMINDIRFRIGKLPEGEQHGWFANKYGGQIGFQYFDALGIKNLYLQSEVNAIRPHTYAHNNVNQSYTSYYHALAHPLGANFIESVSRISYQFDKWCFTAHVMYAVKGISDINENMGEDIFYPVSDGPGQAWIPASSWNNIILQGNTQRIFHLNIDASWAPLDNRSLELFVQVFYRNSMLPESIIIQDSGVLIGGRTQISRLKNFF